MDRVGKGAKVGSDILETGHRLDSYPGHQPKGKPHGEQPRHHLPPIQMVFKVLL